MRYLITQQYPNLVGNHAGYPHICRLLAEKYPKYYKVIECAPVTDIRHVKNRLLERFYYYYDKISRHQHFKQYLFGKCKEMFEKLKEGDEVFLLEYNIKTIHQYELACYIKKHFPKVRIYAMSHLTPSKMETMLSPGIILKWNKPIDLNLTMGSSLSSYFESIGIPKEKISTGFHAVDMDYYHPLGGKEEFSKVTVITIGALQRDYQMLAEIVKKCTDVNWVICKGNKDVAGLFPSTNNVRLVGYVAEEELRRLMNNADISLSVLEDTIGSNVITTSMAMGLAMVVSDVGSIRDYCEDENTIFCENNVDAFVQAVNSLRDKNIVDRMKESSLEIVKGFSIDRTHEWFSNL